MKNAEELKKKAFDFFKKKENNEKKEDKKQEKEKKQKEKANIKDKFRREPDLVNLQDIAIGSSASKAISVLFDPLSNTVIDLNDPRNRKLKKIVKSEKNIDDLEKKWADEERYENNDFREVEDEDIQKATERYDFNEINNDEEDDVVDVLAKYSTVDDFIIKEAYNEEIFTFEDSKLIANINDAYGYFKGEDLRQVKLIIICILYISTLIDTEQMLKQCQDQQDLEFCNSLIKFYTGVIPISNVSIYGINEVVDLKLLEKVVKWEADYSDRMSDMEVVLSIVNKTADLIVAFKKKEMEAHGSENPDPITPFFFTSNLDFDPDPPARGIRLDKATNLKMEKCFGVALDGLYHEFTREINNLDLGWVFVKDDNGIETWYMIEFGKQRGNGPNLLLMGGGKFIYVNFTKRSILRKLFHDSTYINRITNEDLLSLKNVEFNNTDIYRIIDMSKGNEVFKKLSPKEFNLLGKKLSCILNWDWSSSIPMSRLRFESFKSINDFVLVSDKECVFPVPYDCHQVITEGLRFKVKNDTISATLGDHAECKTIDYNVV